MQSFLTWLLEINSADADTRRRGRNVAVLGLGLSCLGLASLPLVVFQPDQGFALVVTLAATVIYFGTYLLARRGYVTAGAGIIILALLLALFGTMIAANELSTAPFYLVLAVLAASLTLRPWQIWAVLVVALLGLALALNALSSDPFAHDMGLQIILGGASMLVVVTLISFLGANTTNGALRAAEQARAESEAAARELANAKADLENVVAERTAELKTALADMQARADEQARLLEEVEQHRHTIRELSVPVIPITATTLIMPLVGALDSTRLQQIQEQALQALQRSSARHLIMDITGVPIVDTQVAQGLLSVVQAARLLGAQVMMVGIRPEVAQAIVGLGLNLQGMYTASDLQSALADIAG